MQFGSSHSKALETSRRRPQVEIMSKTKLTISDVVRVTQELWGPMLNLELTPVEAPDGIPPAGLTASVHIAGQWKGSIRLHISYPLAKWAAAAFLGVPPSEVSFEQVQDCAGELANITADSIKRLVPSPSKISLPSVEKTEGNGLKIEVQASLQAAFHHRGERFIVTIFETDENAVGHA